MEWQEEKLTSSLISTDEKKMEEVLEEERVRLAVDFGSSAEESNVFSDNKGGIFTS